MDNNRRRPWTWERIRFRGVLVPPHYPFLCLAHLLFIREGLSTLFMYLSLSNPALLAHAVRIKLTRKWKGVRQVLDGKGLKQCCGSASIWCRIGSEDDFPFWCRSRSGSRLASKQCRSTCGSYPKFCTCWKIGQNSFIFIHSDVSLQCFSFLIPFTYW